MAAVAWGLNRWSDIAAASFELILRDKMDMYDKDVARLYLLTLMDLYELNSNSCIPNSRIR